MPTAYRHTGQRSIASGIDWSRAMRTFAHGFMRSLAVGIGVAVLMGGCSSGSPGGVNPSGNTPAGTPSAAGVRVTATETEYSISLSTSTFAAGVYTFHVENHGALSHNLNIAAPGGAQGSAATIQPGVRGQVPGTLRTAANNA